MAKALLKVFAFSDLVKWLAIIIAILIFVLFFVFAPFAALIFCGLLVLLSAMYFGLKPKLAVKAFYIGLILIVIGVLGSWIPALSFELRLFAQKLKDLMIFP